MKIRTKLLSILLITSVLPVVIISFLYHQTNVASLTLLAEDALISELSAKNIDIKSFLSGAESDLIFLSSSTAMNAMLQNDDAASRKNLGEEFLAFSKSRQIYYQIRYIDETGQEVVRVDFDRSGTFNVVPENKLQNKGDRYYFTEAMETDSDEIFVSPLDLNKEQGALENRGSKEDPVYVPVIRYAIRVFDDGDNSRGIVITNVYADGMLNSLKQGTTGNISLLNKDGFYLAHSDSEKEWGFMLENEQSFINDYPTVNFEDKLSKESGQFSLSDNLVFFSNVTTAGKQWMLLNAIPRSEITDSVRQDTLRIFTPIIVGIVILIAIVLWLTALITKPIEQLVSFSKGRSKMDPKLMDRKDEIGSLAQSFQRMNASIEFLSQEQSSGNKSSK